MLQPGRNEGVRHEDGVGLCGGVRQDETECRATDAEGHGDDRPIQLKISSTIIKHNTNNRFPTLIF